MAAMVVAMAMGGATAYAESPFPPLAPKPADPKPPYLSQERWEAMQQPLFGGVAQTRADLERLALDFQLFDWCMNAQISDARLAPLLERAARLTGDPPTCQAVMRRLGWPRP
ncbi:MAG: hypothetical protein N2557_00075 [Hydrogenophilus sp.]|nr:hypothetical protein [Hydrogenophilus sp.]